MFRRHAIAISGLLALPLTAAAPAPHLPSQIPGHNALLMGADWYPEQWPESRWETDVAMMEAAPPSARWGGS